MKGRIYILFALFLVFALCAGQAKAFSTGGAYHQNKRKIMKVPSRVPKGFGEHQKGK